VTSRVDAEMALLRAQWPALSYEPAGQWILLPDYPLPEGWSQPSVNVAFQIPAGPPGSPPYAFCVDAPLTFNGATPANYTPTGAPVPFPGVWGQFSWAPEAWPWAEDPAQGANMRAFARSFADRFAEGV
jgi:hypothetical protein